jgi:plastocyanin
VEYLRVSQWRLALPLTVRRSLLTVFSVPPIAFVALVSGAGRHARPVVDRAHGSARVATGRIEGTVIISSVLVARRPRFRIYNDAGPGSLPPAAARADSSAEMQNVVIYIGSSGAGAALATVAGDAAPHPAMTQRDETFDPHVLPVLRGSTVEFPNADDVFHNVFSLSSAKTFDLGRYPKGGSRSLVFNKAGRVDVFCHIHSDMSAIVLVLDNPYFATPDTKGHFIIDSVPPGDYTVIGFHQRIKPVQRHLRVVAGETTKTVFTIPLPSPESP